jgi:integrase
VRNCQAWLEREEISTGPLFRSLNRHGQVRAGRLSGINVARVAKKLTAGGSRSAEIRRTLSPGGHATSAAFAGASERSIMKQTGHRSVQMVKRYIRDGSLFRENSAGKLGCS